MTSPKCQFILDEVIYYDSPQWQNKGILKKTLLFCLQLIFVIITSIGYIFILLCPKCTTCDENCCWRWFRNVFEHPYSKFINHVMSYVTFLCLIYASSFKYEIRAGWGALTWLVSKLLSKHCFQCWRRRQSHPKLVNSMAKLSICERKN